MPFARGQTKPAGSGRKKQAEAPKLEIVYRLVSWLKPYERNPRKNDKAVDRMVASIREFGFAVPVLARSTGEVVDGHLRLKAAVKLNFKEVPVILCDNWTSSQVKAFRLMVNRSVNWADWDLDALSLEFGELKALEFDLTLTGFDSREIDQFTLAANPAEDDVPPVPEVPVTKPGDLWLLGPHRLLCGDATNVEHLHRVTDGKSAEMMFTDPPYGVDYEGGHFHSGDVRIVRKREKIEADDSAAIYAQFLPVVLPYVDGPCYVWFAHSRAYEVFKAFRDNACIVSAVLVWHKINATYAAMNSQYKQRHEPCAYFKCRGTTLRWTGAATESTLWEEKRDPANTMHPSQKPVCLPERAIRNHAVSTVLDVFAGSGSTLIACEKTGKAGVAMEIDPAYCDVITTRWQNLTGKEATLEGDGRTFAELKAERLTPLAAA